MAKYRYEMRGCRFTGKERDKWLGVGRDLDAEAEDVVWYGGGLEQESQFVAFTAEAEAIAALFGRHEMTPCGVLSISVGSGAEPLQP